MRRRQRAPARSEQSVSAGQDAYVAGRDLNITYTYHVYGVLPFQVTPLSRFAAFRRYAITAAVFLAGELFLAWVEQRARAGPERDAVLLAAALLVLLVIGPLLVTRERRQLALAPHGRALAERLSAVASSLIVAFDREQRLRRLQDPFPLPVRWVNCDRLADHWQAIRRDPGDGTPIDLTGTLAEAPGPGINEVFERIPSRRLVVAGSAGAGKSIAALRFARTLLDRRGDGDPVPLILPLASWRPDQDFWMWVADRLALDRGPAARGGLGSVLARELVNAGLIVPVLDGFDEVPAEFRPRMLEILNRTLNPGTPILLTTRVAEYEAAIDCGDVLTASAVIELQPLGLADLASYLPLTAKPVGPGRSTKWAPVLARLQQRPDVPECARLLAVLATPLMTSMARAAYSDTPDDPGELLRPGRFTSTAALEDHLLERFIPAVYPTSADGERALRYLRFLAREATEHDPAAEVSWWRLGDRPPRATRVMTVAGCLAMVGFMACFRFGRAPFVVGLPLALPNWPPSVPLPNWLAFAFALLPAAWAVTSATARPLVPARLTDRNIRHREGAVGFLAVNLLVVFLAILTWRSAGVFCLAIGATANLGALSLARVPGEVTTARSPASLLRSDRRAALVLPFAIPLKASTRSLFSSPVWLLPVLFLAAGMGLDWSRTPAPAESISLSAALLVLYWLSATAWGGFAWARLWLTASGRLPWSLLAFLDDAHQRGVLRQTGASYQFRHARLRERLAGGVSYRPPEPPGKWRVWTRRAAVAAAVAALSAVFISIRPIRIFYDTSSWYEMVNEGSGLCATATGGSTANGTPVDQLACTGATSQLWQFVPTSVSGYYEVVNDNAQSAGEGWNITGGVAATAPGDPLQIRSFGGTDNTNALFASLFARYPLSGYYSFVADNSGLCIDAPSTSSGVQLDQYACNGTPSQAFSLTP